MSRLQTLYDITKELQIVLESEDEEREDVIDKVNDLIDQRELEIKKLSAPYSDAEKEIGQKIVQLNKQIEDDIQKLFLKVKQDMQVLRKQKRTKASYTNPYDNVNARDGMFLDNKL